MWLVAAAHYTLDSAALFVAGYELPLEAGLKNAITANALCRPMSRPILHLSTVHPIDDVRIFRKEVRSLRNAGLNVIVTGVQVENPPADIGPAIFFDRVPSRFKRVWNSFNCAIQTCRDLKPDVLHFHDPEILIALPFLRRHCRVVIYDSHECLSEAVHHKDYLPKVLRSVISIFVGAAEKFLIRYVDAIVVPTPHIAAYFEASGKAIVKVANFPAQKTFPEFVDAREREMSAVYTGGLARVRGLAQMIEAAEETGIMLHLAGAADAESRKLLSRDLPSNIQYHGYVSHSQALALQGRAMVGMSLLMPRKQYLNAIPTKVFEFLAAGLVVVCSDFPFFRQLFAGFKTIRFVDPENVPAVAGAMRDALGSYLALDYDLLNSRERVLREFTWEAEAARLLSYYRSVL